MSAASSSAISSSFAFYCQGQLVATCNAFAGRRGRASIPSSRLQSCIIRRQLDETGNLQRLLSEAIGIGTRQKQFYLQAVSRKRDDVVNRGGRTPPSATPATDAKQEDQINDPDFWRHLLDSQALGTDLSTPTPEQARSLRRKGHLKEQDGLIEFMVAMHSTHTPAEVMSKMERWVREHMQDPRRSKLKQLIPSIGKFYTPLKLTQALKEYDQLAALSYRRYVPPNFAEIRHVLNIAQVHSAAETLRLITFDADGTLYADGAHFKHDNAMIGLIIGLLQSNVQVAVVTAAGYPGNASRFEDRLAGLLTAFRALQLPAWMTDNFHVMGGECNYLLRFDAVTQRLAFVEDDQWKPDAMATWQQTEVEKMLDEAETTMTSAAARLHLRANVIRKERSVGIIPETETTYEVLEDIALSVQMQMVDAPLPFCAFNGGSDVFVDIGNKSLGLSALMQYVNVQASQMLHVGDRFTVSGNDNATRGICSILWVASPEETAFFVQLLLRDIKFYKQNPYIE
eukprot:jgi/Mesvir1/27907/Mv03421-RA.1